MLQPTIRPLPRPKVLALAALFLLAWALRLATLHSTLHPDDSPETVLAGATGGIQHPPGPSACLDSLPTKGPSWPPC